MEHIPSARLTRNQRAWLEHLKAWRTAGGTLKAYAAAHDLSATALYTARRLLTSRGVWPTTADTASTPTFVPLRVRPSAAPLRIVLPDGIVLEVGAHCDVSQCAALVAALGRRP